MGPRKCCIADRCRICNMHVPDYAMRAANVNPKQPKIRRPACWLPAGWLAKDLEGNLFHLGVPMEGCMEIWVDRADSHEMKMSGWVCLAA